MAAPRTAADLGSWAAGGDSQVMLEVVFSGKDNKKQSGVCTEKRGLILALQVAEGTKPTRSLLGRNLGHWARVSPGEIL